MISGYKAAIFDMDGTLLDSMRYWRFGAIEYLLAHQLPIPDSVLASVFDVSSYKTMALASEACDISFDRENALPEILSRMDYHYKYDILLKPGAREYVGKLNELGMRCCVATATPRYMAEKALQKQGMLDMFDFIVDEDDMGASKREPEYFIRLADKLKLKPQECVFHEDALYSIKNAKAVGYNVIAIEDICARKQKAEIIALSDKYINSYNELL